MTEPVPRRILYGRRQGHALRIRPLGLMAELLPRVRLDLEGLRDPLALFPDCGSLALEVGFGGGEHLAAQAKANPSRGFIGCEPFVNGVAKLLAAIERESLANVRLHPDDARDVLERLPEGSLDAAYVLFPDPWPKARHAKRRFVCVPNLALLARALKPGARLRIASDIPAYVRWTLEQVAAHDRAAGRTYRFAARSAADWRERPADWPPTRYEAKAIAAGRRPAFLEFERV